MDWYNEMLTKENQVRGEYIEKISNNLYYSKHKLAKVLSSHPVDSIRVLSDIIEVCRSNLNKDPCSLCDSFLVEGFNLIDLLRNSDTHQDKIILWFYELGVKYNECWVKVKGCKEVV